MGTQEELSVDEKGDVYYAMMHPPGKHGMVALYIRTWN
jgi:hypothetical protein